MSEKDTKNLEENENLEPKEFTLEDFALNTISSAETIKTKEENVFGFEPQPILAEAALLEEETEEVDPIFAELAEPKLPELEKENRARLQMQSPTKLYFYWSIKNNPFQILQKVFAGNTGSYQLVAKLVNQTQEREEIRAVEAEGNWWFNAEADSSYRAEIGFYAPNRPYIRVMFSNTIETPRKNPSPRQATDADWAVSANTFAEVLDVSGFARDAFEVALAGDDTEMAETATQNAFSQLIGERKADSPHSSDEIRFALLALASGISLEDLRGHISETLFAVLQENSENVSAEKSLAALQEHFDVFTDEAFEEETEIGSAVFGASLVNFPKKLKKRAVPKTLSPKFVSKLSPVSSLRF